MTTISQQQQQQHNEVNKITNDILLNNFQIKKKRYRVLFNENHLVWDRLKTTSFTQDDKNLNLKETECDTNQLQTGKYGKHSNVVHINEVVAVGKGKTKNASKKPTLAQVSNLAAQPTENYLSIHYAERIVASSTDCNRWRMRRLTLYSVDPYIVRQWHVTLHKILSNSNDARMRIRRLLVFINPYGGSKQGLKVYERHCKPLFQLAGIDASCIITQRSNQIRDILLSHDLKLYDAVCCVGGDGTAAEVINGLLFRSIHDSGFDLANPAHVPKPQLPIGIIPAGSTDTIAYSLHGTSDVDTAAIHMVLGQKRGLDVCSVRNRLGLLRFCTSVFSYGYLGDVCAKSEKYRWLGTKRYEFVGVKSFLLNRGYEAKIRVLELPGGETETLNETPCSANCDRCKNMSEEASINNSLNSSMKNLAVERNSTSSSGNWKEFSSKYFMITGTNISCSCKRSPNGISPTNHLGDGYMDLILVHNTSLISNVRLLLQSMKKNGDIRKLPFVESHRTKMFHFYVPLAETALENPSISGSTQPIVNTTYSSVDANTEILPNQSVSSWNCDGEVVMDLDITMISHRQLVDVFMRGPYVEPKHQGTSCWSCCK